MNDIALYFPKGLTNWVYLAKHRPRAYYALLGAVLATVQKWKTRVSPHCETLRISSGGPDNGKKDCTSPGPSGCSGLFVDKGIADPISSLRHGVAVAKQGSSS